MHQALVHVFSNSPLCLGHNAMKEASDTKDFLTNYCTQQTNLESHVHGDDERIGGFSQCASRLYDVSVSVIIS